MELFGPDGLSSKVKGPEGIEDIVRRSINYMTQVYGVRATYAEMTYDAEQDLIDGVDDMSTYDDNMFVMVRRCRLKPAESRVESEMVS